MLQQVEIKLEHVYHVLFTSICVRDKPKWYDTFYAYNLLYFGMFVICTKMWDILFFPNRTI